MKSLKPNFLFAPVPSETEGVAGAAIHVNDTPVDTTIIRKDSPDLLLNEIDQRIVKMRPRATPIDTILRSIGAKKSNAQIYQYYSVDTKPVDAKLNMPENYTEADTATATLIVDNGALFDRTDTILVPSVKGYKEDGTTVSNDPLMLYVDKKNDEGNLIVRAVNGHKKSLNENVVPTINNGAKLIRMGRAAQELDVQTPQYGTIPKKEENYCQIFKMQVEESTVAKITDKEVNWTFSDQEENAIYEMKSGMERSFLFGSKRVITNAEGKEVYFAGGIYNKAEKVFKYNKAQFTVETLVDLFKTTFVGNSGNDKRMFFGGSELTSVIEKAQLKDLQRVGLQRDTEVRWGIRWNTLTSKFGTFYYLLHETFDQVDKSDCGLIIDPEYVEKVTFIPSDRLVLDLRKSGTRNTDAVVLTEASCAVMRYPGVHVRVEPTE